MLSGKRADPRFSKDFSLVVENVSADESLPVEDRMIPAELANVSRSGVGFRSPADVAVGTRLRIRIEVDSEGNFPCFITHLGTVRWCRELEEEGLFQVGVQFTGTSMEEMEKWKALVRRWSPTLF